MATHAVSTHARAKSSHLRLAQTVDRSYGADLHNDLRIFLFGKCNLLLKELCYLPRLLHEAGRLGMWVWLLLSGRTHVYIPARPDA